mmetsp:Transcript_6073/g.7716  ORF Transcript_6073/g.7716 Transcript_6073/m.7716 type:complete len:405 (+) Transcript_6073:183-1397(+)
MIKTEQFEILLLPSLLFITSIIIFNSSYVKRVIQCHVQRFHLNKLIRAQAPKTNEAKEEEHHDKIILSGIFIHPIKSLRPISVQSTTFNSLGLEGDRALMLVRPNPSSYSSFDIHKPTHRFLTQRQCPKLATIDASLPTNINQSSDPKKTVIQLSHDDAQQQNEKVFIDVSIQALRSYPVRYKAGLWDDVVDVVDVGDKAASFIQSIIKSDDDSFDDLRVVSVIPNVTDRKTDDRYVPSAAYKLGKVPRVALTDGFPILLASEESLDALNERLVKKDKKLLPMSRFRPNLVVKGLNKAFDEDEWKAIQIGGSDGPIFHVVKGCPRCKQSCTDQLTGERDVEPLETLKEFRALGKNEEDVYFAQNVVLQPSAGFNRGDMSVYVGDEVRVLTRGTPIWDEDTVQAE